MANRTPRLLLSSLKIRLRALVLLPLAALQAGCSGVFFFPDSVTYVTPDRLNLDYEDVYLDTADGETLHGWWLPAKDPETARGTVYFLHGNAQNISSHIFNVAWLPAEGYNIFTLDYRGYGRSTGAPDIEGALHDAEIGMRWLSEQPQARNGRVFILGQSLGGALGIPLASEWIERQQEPRLAGVVVDGTFTGFRGIAREKLGSVWLTWLLQAPLSWTITDDYEAIDRIDNISPVPVLVIHSVRDGIIPFHHGKALYRAAKEPKKFLQTDTPHASTFVIPAYKQELLDFLSPAKN